MTVILIFLFSEAVDRCLCFMNDGEDPVLVFEQTEQKRDIIHRDYYQELLTEAKP